MAPEQNTQSPAERPRSSTFAPVRRWLDRARRHRSRHRSAGRVSRRAPTCPLYLYLLLAATILAPCLGCRPDTGEASRANAGAGSGSAVGSPPAAERGGLPARARFVDVTEESGLDFRHRTGSEGSYPMPAIMGGGAAVFDYDGDGDLDVYFVQAGDRFPADGGPTGLSNRLYRQEGDGRFVDVTEGSGLGHRGYGMGVAVGDIDNDGDADLFVTNWGPDALLRNDGGGNFSEVTSAAGVGGGGWSASATFLDFDRDGHLDLYVTRYVDYDPGKECAAEGGRPDYCGPLQFPGLADLLYRNRGDGTFEDVSRSAGVGRIEDAGLGVLAADFDADGWIDVYVANDSDPNNLWINRHDGTFVDDAVLLGLALNRQGVAEAGMGVTVGDADADGDADLFLSHLIEETNTFYENRGAEGFEDTTATVGLALPSAPYTGFGDALADFDNDGDLDLAVVNGAIKARPEDLAGREDWFWSVYAEPNLLFDNRGDGTFTDVSDGVGHYGEPIEVSRGLVAADFDADGDLDLLVTNVEGPARLYRNEGGSDLAWIQVRLLDPRYQRQALGAQLVAVTPSRRHLRQVQTSSGYLTSSPATVHIGLGSEAAVERFEVRWPDGLEEVFPGAPARRVLTLRRGAGRAHRAANGGR